MGFNDDESISSDSDCIRTVTYDRYVDAADRKSRIIASTVASHSVPITTQTFGDTKLKVLWDSGASSTLISARALKKLMLAGIRVDVIKNRRLPTFTVANGEKTQPTCYVRLTMNIGSSDGLLLGCYVLKGMPNDLIIGSDTLNRRDA